MLLTLNSPMVDYQAAPAVSSMASSAWHCYLKEKRKTGRSMKEIGELWRGLDDDERAKYIKQSADAKAAV